jgi:hypothetical protein
MNISLKMEGVEALLKRLQDFPKLQEKALINAMNVLGRAAAKEAKKGIVEEYNIKSRDLGEGIGLLPARGGTDKRLYTIITAKGTRIPLYDFGALPTAPASQKGIPVKSRKPATVKVLKKGGRHPVFRSAQTGNGPFLATMTKGFDGSGTNHTGIFVRMDKRLRNKIGKGTHQVIREVRAEGIPAMFLKIGGEAMRQLVMTKGAGILRQKIDDQIVKHNLISEV